VKRNHIWNGWGKLLGDVARPKLEIAPARLSGIARRISNSEANERLWAYYLSIDRLTVFIGEKFSTPQIPENGFWASFYGNLYC
jgi:hypothetical protein